jgi:Flp pilus assembly protein TadD
VRNFKWAVTSSIAWPILLTLPLAGCGGPAAMTIISMAGQPILQLASTILADAIDEPGDKLEDSIDLVKLADDLRAKGDMHAAAKIYSRAHVANPTDSAPLIGLGETLLASGANDQAGQAFGRALLLDPENTRALRGMGKTHLKMRQPDLAVTRFETLLAQKPNDLQAINGLGVAYDMVGEHAKAQELYRRGLSINPQSAELRNNLGLSLALSGQSEAAISELRQLAQAPTVRTWRSPTESPAGSTKPSKSRPPTSVPRMSRTTFAITLPGPRSRARRSPYIPAFRPMGCGSWPTAHSPAP